MHSGPLARGAQKLYELPSFEPRAYAGDVEWRTLGGSRLEHERRTVLSPDLHATLPLRLIQQGGEALPRL